MGAKRSKDFGLPKYVYRNRGKLYYAPPGEKWVKLEESPELAQQQAAHLHAIRATPDMKGFADLRNCFERTRKNARQREIQFCLSWDDVVAMWNRSRGKCEVSGIAFCFVRDARHKNRPFAPSIDRKDNAGVYSPENCRLVCVSVNLAMNEWGLENLLRVVAAVHRRRKILAAG